MRWRIAIAVLAVVGIAGAVYVGTQPRKGSVEWHKEQWIKANERTPVTQLMKLKVVPRTIRNNYFREADEKAAFHWKWLIDAGYLTQRVVAVSNHPVFPRLSKGFADAFTNDTLSFIIMGRTNGNVIVTAPVTAIDQIEEIIRKDDTLQTEKRR